MRLKHVQLACARDRQDMYIVTHDHPRLEITAENRFVHRGHCHSISVSFFSRWNCFLYSLYSLQLNSIYIAVGKDFSSNSFNRRSNSNRRKFNRSFFNCFLRIFRDFLLMICRVERKCLLTFFQRSNQVL